MRNRYKKTVAFLIAAWFLCFGIVFSGSKVQAAGQTVRLQGTYLGVANYGMQGTDIAHADSFMYQFMVGGNRQYYTIAKDAEYSIQNCLVHGKSYILTITNQVITAISPVEAQTILNPAYLPAQGTPGKRTLKNLLKTAMMPVGSTLYVYGGGWNWQDNAAGAQTRTLGVSTSWYEFYRANVSNYSYKTAYADSYYPYGGFNEYYYAGLDCSGYMGWTLYNTFETSGGRAGYVTKSTGFAKSLANRGWGTIKQNVTAVDGTRRVDMRPGDIVSINGHVWMSFGTCRDGSVLVAHSIPSASRNGKKGGGVQLSAIGTGADCEAYRLADHFMRTYCPGWYQYYSVQLISPGAYETFSGTDTGRFRWDTSGTNGGLEDPDGISGMTPEQILKAILE